MGVRNNVLQRDVHVVNMDYIAPSYVHAMVVAIRNRLYFAICILYFSYLMVVKLSYLNGLDCFICSLGIIPKFCFLSEFIGSLLHHLEFDWRLNLSWPRGPVGACSPFRSNVHIQVMEAVFKDKLGDHPSYAAVICLNTLSCSVKL